MDEPIPFLLFGEPRTYAQVGAETRSGVACESCGVTYETCTARVLEHGRACCPTCGYTDTHASRVDGRSAYLHTSLESLVHRFGFNAVEAELGRIKISMNGPLAQVGERDGDQRTSKGKRSADVRRFSRNSLSGRLLAEFGRNSELTDREATDEVVGTVESGLVSIGRWEGCRRRCSDLREAGYLQDSGLERDDRIAWRLTPTGAAALERLYRTGWTR